MTLKSVVFVAFSFVTIALFGGFFHAVEAHEVADPNTTVIHMYNDRYEPRDITIEAGETVIFENVSEMTRWPASNIHPTHRGYPNSDINDCNTPVERGMFDACREIPIGGTYTFVFNEVGVWPYHDHVSAEITGTITVLSPASDIRPNGWWQKITTWFGSLFGWLFNNDSENEAATSEGVSANARLFDESIPLVTSTVATDVDALYAHVRKYGAEATLAQLTALEPEYGSCHDNAHYVGRFSFELLGTEAFKACSMGCHSGCYHGAVEAYFREYGTANLAESINTICSSSVNDFVVHQCHHGVGHGLMAWSSYELFDALGGCDLLEDATARSSCYSGVFMENIVQSMTVYVGIEGHTTAYISDDPHYPCTIVGDRYQPNCYFLQTDRMLTVANGDFATVVGDCSTVENVFSRQNCFLSLGRTTSGRLGHQAEEIISICNLVSEPRDRQHCLTGAVQDTFWDEEGSDAGLAFCNALTEESDTAECYTQLFARAPHVLSTTESREKFCAKVPGGYEAQCELQLALN